MPPLARLISLGILTTLIVLLGITFYQVLAPFLLPLFLAWVTAILCRPLYLWAVERTGRRPRLAAGLTTAALLLVVLLPLALGTVFAAAQLIGVATNLLDREDDLRQRLTDLTSDPRVVAVARWLEPYLAEVPDETSPTLPQDPAYAIAPERDPFLETHRLELPTTESPSEDPDAEPREPTPEELKRAAEEEARAAEEARRQLELRLQASVQSTLRYVGARTIGLVSEVPGVALGVLGQAVSLLVALVMFSIGLYYFLCDGPELIKAAEALIPVRNDYQQELLRRFDQVVRAVVLSTFLSALAQGILTTIALWALDFHHLFVFFVLASLAAMIPLAGTWVVWAPCAAWLALHEHAYLKAAGLVIFGLVVVGTVDNLIRTYILNSSAKLHPLLAFVSVLGGLQVMGLWGVFIAPVVAACLHALIQIFNAELKTFSQERAAVRDGTDDDEMPLPTISRPTASPTSEAPASPLAEREQPAEKPQRQEA
ncbi:MAG: AI-2E family transporter [Planctomycetaceae bacterium]